jgi:hypothetical protein
MIGGHHARTAAQVDYNSKFDPFGKRFRAGLN